MAKSSPHPGLEVTVPGIFIAGCEEVFASRGKRDVYRAEVRNIEDTRMTGPGKLSTVLSIWSLTPADQCRAAAKTASRSGASRTASSHASICRGPAPEIRSRRPG